MDLFSTSKFCWLMGPAAGASWIVHFLWSAIVVEGASKRTDIYNILWVLVFGFATLNILGLVARKFEPERSRLSFGESLAIMVVVVSILLLGWEMLYFFKILPIKLKP